MGLVGRSTLVRVTWKSFCEKTALNGAEEKERGLGRVKRAFQQHWQSQAEFGTLWD